MVLSQKRLDCPLQVQREILPQVEEFEYLWHCCPCDLDPEKQWKTMTAMLKLSNIWQNIKNVTTYIIYLKKVFWEDIIWFLYK